MSKGIEAFNNILAEGDFRYFSSLYDRDMFRQDVITVKKELEAFNIIKNSCYISIDKMLSQNYITRKEYNFLKEVLNDEH